MFHLLFFILVLAALMSILKDVFFRHTPASIPNVPNRINCPHCKAKNDIMDDGIWECQACQKKFETYNSVAFKHNVDLPVDMQAMIELFAKITKSDGVVTKREIQVVDHLIKAHYHPTHDQLVQIRALFNLAKQSPMGYEKLVSKLRSRFPKDEGVREKIVGYLFQIAMADNPLDDRQKAIICFAIKQFKVSKTYDDFFKSYQPSKPNKPEITRHYLILESSEKDSLETIKKNYRRLIKEHHPDRLVHQNASHDFIMMANQKIKDIHQAYEIIIKSKKTNQV